MLVKKKKKKQGLRLPSSPCKTKVQLTITPRNIPSMRPFKLGIWGPEGEAMRLLDFRRLAEKRRPGRINTDSPPNKINWRSASGQLSRLDNRGTGDLLPNISDCHLSFRELGGFTLYQFIRSSLWTRNEIIDTTGNNCAPKLEVKSTIGLVLDKIQPVWKLSETSVNSFSKTGLAFCGRFFCKRGKNSGETTCRHRNFFLFSLENHCNAN